MARTGPKPEIQSIETIPDARGTLAIPTAEELRALYDASPEEIETEEPDAGERTMDLHGGPVDAVEEMVRSQAYADESSKLYIGRVFKPAEFAAWFAAQRLGSLPFHGVSIHHTYIPDEDDFAGVSTIHGVFNYYANTLKWPRGRGPHFWLYGGDGRYGTQPLIGVGTHPAHDGIAVSYRNHRWAGIEAFGYYDSRHMPQSMIDLYRFTLQTICGSRIPIKNAGAGVDGPKSPIGQIFHRNAPNAGKSCPGWRVKESWFFPAMQKKTPTPVKEQPYPIRKYNFLHALPEHREIAKAATEAINAALVKAGKKKLATYAGSTPEKVAFATRKSAEGKFGEVVSILVGEPVTHHVHPAVSLVGAPDETDTWGSYKVYPSMGSADAVGGFLSRIVSREKLSAPPLMADYRSRLGKAQAR